MTGRSLDDWLGYLEQLHPTAIDMGLDRCREVASRLGLSRPAPRVVTVTGTNGKGSTCAFVASLLRAQGLKVGVYSSPHLRRYNERVRIDDTDVEDGALCEAFAAVDAARGEISLTYFEMGTLAAFWLFEQVELDVAVLEVGLGGRLDAVNLVDADVSIVTNIGLDHGDWLGDTRDSVAFEKAGIFRPGKPAICGDLDPPATLIECADQLGTRLLLRKGAFDFEVNQDTWCWSGVNAAGDPLTLRNLPLLALPIENAALALQAFVLLDLPWTPEPLGDALLRTCVVGRLDRRTIRWKGRSVSLLMDVGHNPHAAGYLAAYLRQQSRTARRLAVFGLLADKDLDGILDTLVPIVDHWAVTPLPTTRSRSALELQTTLRQRDAKVTIHSSVAQALESQLDRAADGEEILLFGSFYCVAEGLDWLDRHVADGGQGFAG